MTAHGDSHEATSSREKILKVFGYLKALNEHRNPAKRQIKDHAWSFWLDDIPDHPAVQRTLRRKDSTDETRSETSQTDLNVILRVRRPQLTQCPSPPEGVRAWLNRGWEQPENVEVQWIESLNEIDNDGETIIVHFKDDGYRDQLGSAFRSPCRVKKSLTSMRPMQQQRFTMSNSLQRRSPSLQRF